MKASTQKGQAMIEFAAGLLVLLLLIIGFVHISKLALTSLGIHGEIRADAGMAAMQSTLTDAPEAISDWESGTDETRFTADDEMQKNQPAAATIMNSLVSHSVKAEGDWERFSEQSVLPFSMVTLSQSPNLTTLMGAVHESQTERVTVDPFIRRFSYNKPEVAVQEEIWMPLMGGLY
jgi:Flp pilus assembly protein TadG